MKTQRIRHTLKNWRHIFALLLPVLGIALLARVPATVSPHGAASGATSATLQPNAPSSVGSSKSEYIPQATPEVIGQATIIHSVKNDISPPLWSMKPAPPVPGTQEGPENPSLLPTLYPKVHPKDTLVQNWFGALAIPTPITSWDGVDSAHSFCACAPPDTNGDVGPNNYVQWVNTSIEIWNKTGQPVFGPVRGNTIWQGFGGPCEALNSGDPIALYDSIADRWMISQFTTSPPYYQCIAVSQSPNPTGQWYRYGYMMSTNMLYDYPHFGVWPDGYYMTVNRFLNGQSFDSPAFVAFDRTQMLTGQPGVAQQFNPGNYFFAILPSDLDGPTLPPAGAPNYFGTTSGTANTFREWRLHINWNNPGSSSLTGPFNAISAPFDGDMCGGNRNCIPQPGTSNKLDAIAGRTMYRLAYRNMGDHEVLLSNTTVDVDGTDHAGIRWQEIRDPNGFPYIYQEGTYSPDSANRWMGGIAMDRNGDIALGYSVSSSTVFPSVRYTGRLETDPLGTMPQGEGTIVDGASSQTGVQRWGDYSMMSIDPSDDCTFWYTQEYFGIGGGSNWKTRIGSFKFPSCGGTPTVTPTGTPPTATRTPTPRNTPTPTALVSGNYLMNVATATIISGTTDIGNHCDDCTTYYTLPFPVQLYDRTFTNAFISSNGVIEFDSSDNAFGNACLPVPVFYYSIIPYWDDLDTSPIGGSCSGFPGNACGIFTTVEGSAPNRVLDIEWRANILGPPSRLANFEVRLFEGQVSFEMLFGSMGGNGSAGTTGVQRDGGGYTQYQCNSGGLTNHLKITAMLPVILTATPIPTSTPGGNASLVMVPDTTTTGLCPAPANGGSTNVGCTFSLAMLLNVGSRSDATAQQSYLTFTYQLIQNARVDQIGTSCVPTNTVSPDLTTFDAALQNEVCDGPAQCNFRGVTVDPGSFAYASGALSNCDTGCGGIFRVAQVGVCAVAPGTARMHWQFTPPDPVVRDTEVVAFNGDTIHNRALFADYVFTINGAGGTPTFTPTASFTPTNPPTFTPVAGRTNTPTSTPVRPTNTPVYTNTPVRTGTSVPNTPTRTATTCPMSFTDITSGMYCYDAVRYLACAGAVSGYPDHTFHAADDTTRGQVCKIVVLALGWPIDTRGGPHFTDVLPSNMLYNYIETIYNHGSSQGRIISGYGDGTFRPSNMVTRAQLSKIVVLSKDWPTYTVDGPHFTDVPRTHLFYNYVETAYLNGIVVGYSDHTFHPDNDATRGQVSVVIYRAIPRVGLVDNGGGGGGAGK